MFNSASWLNTTHESDFFMKQGEKYKSNLCMGVVEK
jgi:hypothetical protein